MEQAGVDKLLKLIEQHTRADVMSRVGALPSDVCFAHYKVEVEDKIRELLYGSKDLMVLANKFGIRK